MRYLFSTAVLAFALLSCNSSNANNQKGHHTEILEVSNVDSLAVVKLGENLNKLAPLSPDVFKTKLKKEINGFTLTEVEAFISDESGAYCTANYKKGDASAYLMISDGAGVGANSVVESLLNFLELKKIEEPGDKLNIKPYKGHQAYFDYSMFDGDGVTSIQYLEGDRYLVVSSGNGVTIDELKGLLDNFSL